MNRFPFNQLGSTALSVPQIGLGTGPLGNLYRSVQEEEAVETIRYAFSQGINYFDTAPLYGGGLAEQRLGIALKDLSRDQYIISTKVGRKGSSIWDFSEEGIVGDIERSLERLQCDYVDILLIHDPDDYYDDALNQAYPVLADLRSKGRVKAIGAGMNQWQMLTYFAENADFDCFMLAGRYSLLEQEALSFMDLCQEKNISILLGGVYNSGILATGARPGAKYNYRDAPSEIMEKVRRIEVVCQRFEVPLAAAALQFPLGHPAVSSLVIGCSSAKRIDSNLTLHELDIPPSLWTALREEGLLSQDVPVPQS